MSETPKHMEPIAANVTPPATIELMRRPIAEDYRECAGCHTSMTLKTAIHHYAVFYTRDAGAPISTHPADAYTCLACGFTATFHPRGEVTRKPSADRE